MYAQVCLSKYDCVCDRIQYMCVSACVCALLSMPACHSDLPITRSIKPLIPKIHASNSTTLEKKKISLKEKKWLNLPFPVAWSLSHTPVQRATEHEHGNVFYLHNHTGRGLTGTLNPGKAATFTLLRPLKKKINTQPQ